MNIVLCYNEKTGINYNNSQIILLSSCLISFFEHNQAKEKINIYIIYYDIEDKTRKFIQKLINSYNQNVFFIKFPKKFSKELNFMMENSIPANAGTFLRLFIGELLPNIVKKVIYFDYDIIFNGSLLELYYNSSFENTSLQVVLDTYTNFSRKKEKKFGLLNMSYFNAGFLFINLKKVRTSLLQTSIKVFSKNQGIFADQDALNIGFNNDIKIISSKYNILVDENYYRDGIVFHYTSRGKLLNIKPSNIHSMYKKKFWFYVKKTGYSPDHIPIKSSNLIIFIASKIFPKKFLSFLNNFIN